MGAYYRDVVVVIELGAYIHGVLTFNGCLLSRFYGILLLLGLLGPTILGYRSMSGESWLAIKDSLTHQF